MLQSYHHIIEKDYLTEARERIRSSKVLSTIGAAVAIDTMIRKEPFLRSPL
jgi:hypothetical protein